MADIRSRGSIHRRIPGTEPFPLRPFTIDDEDEYD
jgi:hypothetical protein